MKIILVCCVWQRPELTRIILNHYRGMDIMRLACGSEGEVSKQLVESRGWDYVEYPNESLSHKHTALFKKAKEYNPDAVLLIGSDDLISTKLIDYYQNNYSAEAEYMLGLKDLYFYHSKTKQAIHHKGFIGAKHHWTIGCGRIFSRRLLDKIDWKLWGDEKLSRGLDNRSSKYLESKKIPEKQTTMSQSGIAVDIKTDVGLTKMETFNFNCEAVNSNIFDFEFAETMAEINNLYTFVK